MFEGAVHRPWFPLALAGLAIALAVVVHANTLRNPFVWDDVVEIHANASIEDLSRPLAVVRYSPTRPLVNLSYAVDYRIWGGRDEFGFHLTNLLLHLANVGLLFSFTWLVVRDLGRSRGSARDGIAHLTAFTAAALLAVHPMMTETVGYVASRSELLCGVFVLSALLAFRRAFEPRAGRHESVADWRWVGAAMLGFGLALGTKETAAMFPFVLFAYDGLLRPDSPDVKRARFWRLHVPLVMLVLIGGALRIWLFLAVEHPNAAEARGYALLLQAHVVARYVRLLLFPVGQTIVHVVSPIHSVLDSRVLFAAVGLGLAGAVAVLARRGVPIASFGLLCFFLLLVPSSALTLLSEFGQSMSEHRTYMASFGFFMAAGAVVAWLAGVQVAPGGVRQTVVLSGLIMALAVLAGAAIARNRVWASSSTLWADAAGKNPYTWLAVHGLAEAGREAGDCPAALDSYRRAIELAPHKGESYLGMAWCFLDLRQIASAAETLRLGMWRAPGNTAIPLQLAEIEERYFRNPGEALRLCRDALALAPDLAAAQDCVQRNQRLLSNRRRRRTRRVRAGHHGES